MRNLCLLTCMALALGLSACGGGSSGDSTTVTTPTPPTTPVSPTPPPTPSSTANQVAITVNQGLSGQPDTPNVSVTICVPGTTTCQTIPNVLLDTGSFGLRLFASSVTIPLPTRTTGSGTLTNCAQFGLGTTYGSVRLADIKLAGETASSTSIQMIADPNFSTAPSTCSNHGALVTSPAALGSNGILGIGSEPIDCPGCVTNASAGAYYNCASSSSCTQTTAAAALQVTNPVVNFPQDNNGASITLPSVAATGSAGVSGTLTFGIGTQANNVLGSAAIYTITTYAASAQYYGTFTTLFNGGSNVAFVDSGSNGLFFNDSGIAQCTISRGFYCPASTLNLNAVMQGNNGTNSSQNFSIANAQTLFSSSVYAMSNLGGTETVGYFDWGLPFFFGRTIYTAIDGHSTPGGSGPYIAF